MAPSQPVRLTRDLIAFVVGVGGMVHETVLATEPRLIIIAACFGMMGLPLPTILKLDGARREEADK